MTGRGRTDVELGGLLVCGLGCLLLLASLLVFWVQGSEKERGNCVYEPNAQVHDAFLEGRLVPEAMRSRSSAFPPGTICSWTLDDGTVLEQHPAWWPVWLLAGGTGLAGVGAVAAVRARSLARVERWGRPSRSRLLG